MRGAWLSTFSRDAMRIMCLSLAGRWWRAEWETGLLNCRKHSYKINSNNGVSNARDILSRTFLVTYDTRYYTLIKLIATNQHGKCTVLMWIWYGQCLIANHALAPHNMTPWTWVVVINSTWSQGCNFITVCENKTWLQLLPLLNYSVWEIDSHMWMLWESLRELILWFSSNL